MIPVATRIGTSTRMPGEISARPARPIGSSGDSSAAATRPTTVPTTAAPTSGMPATIATWVRVIPRSTSWRSPTAPRSEVTLDRLPDDEGACERGGDREHHEPRRGVVGGLLRGGLVLVGRREAGAVRSVLRQLRAERAEADGASVGAHVDRRRPDADAGMRGEEAGAREAVRRGALHVRGEPVERPHDADDLQSHLGP